VTGKERAPVYPPGGPFPTDATRGRAARAAAAYAPPVSDDSPSPVLDADPAAAAPSEAAPAAGGVPASALADDPVYREGIVDLLGVLAYSELVAFERLAADASLAPTISDEAALALMAVAEIRHFTALVERIAELGADPSAAMAPFQEPLAAFHESTAPSDWLEGLVKAYVGDGIATDFYREIAERLDPETRALVLDVCGDTGHSNFAVAAVRAAIEADPRLGGRLALWGRRLVGEAIQQAQRVVAEREPLMALLVDDASGLGLGLTGLGEMFGRLTDAHTRRMQTLGLQA